MRLLLPATLLTLALFLGGCFHTSAQPPDKSPTPPSTSNNSDVTTSTTEVDTSNWQTYTNKEYGFSFRYPGEWGYVHSDNHSFGSFIQVGENEKRYLAVTITDFTRAPIEAIDQGEAGVISSKDNLMKYKKFLKEETTSKNIDDLTIGKRGIGYYPPGGDFLLLANSFASDNLIEFKNVLRVGSYDPYVDEFGHINRESINKKAKELDVGIGSPEELTQIALFDAIINTIKPTLSLLH